MSKPDITIILAAYNMQRYIDYLEEHSEYGLVTSDKKKEWCLGDWCTPIILYPGKDIGRYEKQVFLPAPFVNNYFMIKSLEKMCDIAHIIGKDDDIAEYKEKIRYRKGVTQAAYYDKYNGSFFGNINGYIFTSIIEYIKIGFKVISNILRNLHRSVFSLQGELCIDRNTGSPQIWVLGNCIEEVLYWSIEITEYLFH